MKKLLCMAVGLAICGGAYAQDKIADIKEKASEVKQRASEEIGEIKGKLSSFKERLAGKLHWGDDDEDTPGPIAAKIKEGIATRKIHMDKMDVLLQTMKDEVAKGNEEKALKAIVAYLDAEHQFRAEIAKKRMAFIEEKGKAIKKNVVKGKMAKKTPQGKH